MNRSAHEFQHYYNTNNHPWDIFAWLPRKNQIIWWQATELPSAYKVPKPRWQQSDYFLFKDHNTIQSCEGLQLTQQNQQQEQCTYTFLFASLSNEFWCKYWGKQWGKTLSIIDVEGSLWWVLRKHWRDMTIGNENFHDDRGIMCTKNNEVSCGIDEICGVKNELWAVFGYCYWDYSST